MDCSAMMKYTEFVCFVGACLSGACHLSSATTWWTELVRRQLWTKKCMITIWGIVSHFLIFKCSTTSKIPCFLFVNHHHHHHNHHHHPFFHASTRTTALQCQFNGQLTTGAIFILNSSIGRHQHLSIYGSLVQCDCVSSGKVTVYRLRAW